MHPTALRRALALFTAKWSAGCHLVESGRIAPARFRDSVCGAPPLPQITRREIRLDNSLRTGDGIEKLSGRSAGGPGDRFFSGECPVQVVRLNQQIKDVGILVDEGDAAAGPAVVDCLLQQPAADRAWRNRERW